MKSITFITSSRVKIAHAKHLAELFGIEISGKSYYGMAYQEPRCSDRDELLDDSYKDALERWRKTTGRADSFFFIEDTSVVIHALSAKGEFPGADVKYWMKSASFAELDTSLRSAKNDRRVTVRSDVVLHLPEWFREKIGAISSSMRFTGFQRGVIVQAEVPIETNVLFPWLDSKSFNKWFVPDGCQMPLSSLPIEIADAFDFRRDSIGSMFKFLEEHDAFIERKRNDPGYSTQFLPNFAPPILLVMGLPCAGKTTLGVHLSSSHGYYHIEASDFMKRAFHERHGYLSDVSIESFAERILQADPSIVVAHVLREIIGSRSDLVIVTGFRSSEEVRLFKLGYLGPSQVLSWVITANSSLRYRRSSNRARSDAPTSFERFKQRDKTQKQMGLGRIIKDHSCIKVTNEAGLCDYLAQCTARLNVSRVECEAPTRSKLNSRPMSLETAILLGLAALESEGRGALSTTEIAHSLNELFADPELDTNKNNVSRYFNFRPSAYYQVQNAGGVAKFSLSATGRSRASRLLSNYLVADHRPRKGSV